MSQTDENYENFKKEIEECDFPQAILDILNQLDLKTLKSALTDGSGVDRRKKKSVCLRLVQISTEQICSQLKRFEVSQHQKTDEDQKKLSEITGYLGITQGADQDTDSSGTDWCEYINNYLLKRIKELKAIRKTNSKRPTNIYPTLKKWIALSLFFLGTLHTVETCPVEQKKCTIELKTAVIDNVNMTRGFVVDDIVPEVDYFVKDQDIVQLVREDIEKTKQDGEQKKSVATFILGPPGAGKGTLFRKVVEEHPEYQDGLAGAYTLNTDDIMESLPGYSPMLHLGTMSGYPISRKDAAKIYHDPAKKINKKIMDQLITEKKSFIFDGTGANVDKLRHKIQKVKDAGYEIQVVVITADMDTRQKRVYLRSIITGRYVPETVVAGGQKDTYEWDKILNELGVTRFVIRENN